MPGQAIRTLPGTQVGRRPHGEPRIDSGLRIVGGAGGRLLLLRQQLLSTTGRARTACGASRSRESRRGAETGDATTQPARGSRVRDTEIPRYREERTNWRGELKDRVARVNDVLGAHFGVQLEVTAAKPWKPASDSNENLPMLGQLEQHDKGEDVDLVVGLLGAQSLVAMSFDELGTARDFGKHFVVRALNNDAERTQIRTAFHWLEQLSSFVTHSEWDGWVKTERADLIKRLADARDRAETPGAPDGMAALTPTKQPEPVERLGVQLSDLSGLDAGARTAFEQVTVCASIDICTGGWHAHRSNRPR